MLAILLFTLLITVTTIRWHNLPAEDALMLMRYANHLAAGQGITWNVGEHPVEGATDFLFLVALAAWMKISHLGAIYAARTLLTIFHVAAAGFLYYSSRRLFDCNRAIAAVLALYLAMGPGIIHATNGFSGPFYAFMASVAWYFALKIILSGSTTARALGFACFALLTGLTRPDGVFLAIFMAAAILYALRGRAMQTLLITMGIFIVFGGAYFLWRWHYFGYLLPNPFYKKGGGHLYPDSLKHALSNVSKMLLPTLPIYLLGLLAPLARRRTLIAMIPVVCFSCIWILLTNENNLGMRFQYVLLPISLMSMPFILDGLADEAKARGWKHQPGLQRSALVAASGVLVLSTILISSIWWKNIYPGILSPLGSGAFNIAVGLSRWEDKHYTIVATEAGVIPYFSHWRSIDGWGLNDAEIVHNPAGLTDAYLDQNHPAIIMFYLEPLFPTMEEFNEVWRGDAPRRKDISQLLNEMSHYAVTHDYELAARWGASPCNVNIWYVKRGLPETQQMVDLIRTTPYFEPYTSFQPGINFLNSPDVTCKDSEPKVYRNQ